jgi:hypothetical protein
MHGHEMLAGAVFEKTHTTAEVSAVVPAPCHIESDKITRSVVIMKAPVTAPKTFLGPAPAF